MNGIKLTNWMIVRACQTIAIEWPTIKDRKPIAMIPIMTKTIKTSKISSPHPSFDSCGKRMNVKVEFIVPKL
jgi:hypothetical protein